MKEIKERLADIVAAGHGLRIEVILETLDGEEFLVISQKDMTRFEPSGQFDDCQIMDLDFEDVIFELKRRRYE